MAKFEVGDKIVYPAQGVAEILAIEIKEISGKEQTFYILRVIENSMKLMVPASNVEQIGIRAISCRDDVQQVYQVLRKKNRLIESTTWNRRYRDYMEKIKSGSIFEVAGVLRDLCVLKNDKELSFGERKMLDTARSLLVTEISLAEGISQEEVENQFREIFQA